MFKKDTHSTILTLSRTLLNFKIVLLGEASVGKSAIVLRFTKNIFPDSIETTIGAAFSPYNLILNSTTTLKLEIWDTAGQERFASLAPMYYRGAAAALVVFDQSNFRSYERAQAWVRQLKNAASSSIIIALIANKADLHLREVDLFVASTYADANGLLFFETSAKTGQNINLVFLSIGEEIYSKLIVPEYPSTKINAKDINKISLGSSIIPLLENNLTPLSNENGFKLDHFNTPRSFYNVGNCCHSSH